MLGLPMLRIQSFVNIHGSYTQALALVIGADVKTLIKVFSPVTLKT
jgi:hypothetical protein